MPANITITQGGIIKSGNYGHIETNGDVRIESGVRFQTLQVNGDVEAVDLSGSSLTLNGTLRLTTGIINVATLQGKGSILGRGDIHANSIDLQGFISTDGCIYAKYKLTFSGLMEGQKMVAARDMNILGVVNIEALMAQHVCIKTMHPKVVPLKDVKWMVRPSKVTNIFCREAELHKCGCHFLQSYSAELREGTFVYDAVCIDTITTDKSSAAVMTLGGAKRCHVPGY